MRKALSAGYWTQLIRAPLSWRCFVLFIRVSTHDITMLQKLIILIIKFTAYICRYQQYYISIMLASTMVSKSSNVVKQVFEFVVFRSSGENPI